MIIVGNVRHGLPGIYIGRAVRYWRASPLGNPFEITKGRSREKAIALYREWLTAQIQAGDEAIIGELKRIKDLSRQGDVRLLCWCTPAHACHGAVIREVLESME